MHALHGNTSAAASLTEVLEVERHGMDDVQSAPPVPGLADVLRVAVELTDHVLAAPACREMASGCGIDALHPRGESPCEPQAEFWSNRLLDKR